MEARHAVRFDAGRRGRLHSQHGRANLKSEILNPLADFPVALAGSFFQCLTVNDCDHRPVVSNDSIVSKDVAKVRDSSPSSAQMLRDCFVRQRQVRSVGAVLDH